ncbi:hypothetical protein C8F04DRAFT_1276122 [Mycena alexandri]|uniref:Uncharacterized protein n=1 Tax=Mycena alexandri TaxID=1745969 RepID=A0AAD6WSN0_9AGAR|nr:hypothetical protein C8F04DRAFT_1276122 [Mycena alexandri]
MLDGTSTSSSPAAPSMPSTRPRPRPAWAAAASSSTVNVAGSNFLADARKSSLFPKSLLFECFRAPGSRTTTPAPSTTSASSASPTTAAASPTTTPAPSTTSASSASPTTAAASPTTAAAVSLADALVAAAASSADALVSSPKKGSYQHWRQQQAGAKTTTTIAPTTSPTTAQVPTKAAAFLTSLLTASSSPLAVATAPITPVRPTPQPAEDRLWVPVLPTTRPPTKAATVPAKRGPTGKAAGTAKKDAVAAKADKKEGAANPGRPRKQPVAAGLVDATNLPALEEEVPVVRRFRAPVDQGAINNRRRSREAAEKEKAAEQAAAEKEKADQRALEAERGWSERVVDGARVVVLMRARKSAKHPDGSDIQTNRAKKAPAAPTTVKTRSWADASARLPTTGMKRKAVTQATHSKAKKYVVVTVHSGAAVKSIDRRSDQRSELSTQLTPTKTNQI